jgi:alcohol dehydrogenase class IV
MNQKIFSGKNSHLKIEEILLNLKCKKFLLVHDGAFKYISFNEYFNMLSVPYVTFSGFTPNPLYESVCDGVDFYQRENCDVIIAVGGGSCIDVAKCIKLYCKMDSNENYLYQECKDTGVPLIVLPTTAGTGSESTRYSVIYFEGQKQSIAHESILPNFVILEPEVLKSLPLYQKKCTLLDALCQGIESWWSVNSTDESKEYSEAAIKIIMQNVNEYIELNSDESAEAIMLAANYAGRAINITQTTAPHAMSYILTSTYDLPHGHAVAICLPIVWRYMYENLDRCIDKRGRCYLENILAAIASSMGTRDTFAAIKKFKNILIDWSISMPQANNELELKKLSESVNPVRLKNNPVEIAPMDFKELYRRIVC